MIGPKTGIQENANVRKSSLKLLPIDKRKITSPIKPQNGKAQLIVNHKDHAKNTQNIFIII